MCSRLDAYEIVNSRINLIFLSAFHSYGRNLRENLKCSQLERDSTPTLTDKTRTLVPEVWLRII